MYADALKEYKTLLSTARDQLVARGVPLTLWPADVPPPPNASARGEGNEEAAAEDEVDTMIKGLDPVMKTFLETERRIKRRKRERERQEAKRKASPPARDVGVKGPDAML